MGIAALAGVVANRFKNVAAGVVALAAGVSPWLFVAIMCEWIPAWNILVNLGLFGGFFMFLVALLRYCLGAKSPGWRIAAGCMIGEAVAAVAFVSSMGLG